MSKKQDRMKFKTTYIFLLAIILMLLSCEVKKSTITNIKDYVPVDKELYNTIVELDNKFFNAYNTCDLKTQELMISANIEFFNDKGGLSTSKKKLWKP